MTNLNQAVSARLINKLNNLKLERRNIKDTKVGNKLKVKIVHDSQVNDLVEELKDLTNDD